jgi:hypothetical protein
MSCSCGCQSIVHRALVTYSNSSTGEVKVKIPSALGVDSEIALSTIGRSSVNGYWAVPEVGTQIVVSSDDVNMTNVFWLQTEPYNAPATGGTTVTALDNLVDVTLNNPTSSQVLTYNGAQWVNDTGAGLNLIKTQSVGSGVTEFTVTNAFNNDYDHYKIVFVGGSQSSFDADWLTFQFSTSSQMFYTSNGVRMEFGSITSVGSYSDSWNAGFTFGGRSFLDIDVYNPFNTTVKFMSTICPANYGMAVLHNICETAFSYTDFTVKTYSTFGSGGTIRIYGFRN